MQKCEKMENLTDSPFFSYGIKFKKRQMFIFLNVSNFNPEFKNLTLFSSFFPKTPICPKVVFCRKKAFFRKKMAYYFRKKKLA